MATWSITNQYKKSAIEKQYWYKDGKEIIRIEGYRWGVWTCDSDEKPEIDLANEDEYRIGSDDYEWEMEEMLDGCWADWVFPEDMDDDEQEDIEDAWNEDFFEGLEELGWSLDETEYIIEGPIALTNTDTNEKFFGEEPNNFGED